jgi:paraquat-inducible protein A
MTLGGRRFLLAIAIVGASVCLALGISLPIIKLTKFLFFTTEHSLLSTVGALLGSGQIFLGLTVLVFSIVLPVVKLLYLLLLSTLPQKELARLSRQLRAMEWLGKWSMHDVLVLSLMIFFIKSQGVYDASSLNGVYFFTAAIIFMILGFSWLHGDSVDTAKQVVVPEGAAPPRSAPFRNFVLSFLIIVATVFFALGIIMPAIKFTTVYVWKNEHSILSIVYALYSNEEFFLCGVIAMFSVVFPFLKLLYLLTLVTSPDMPQEFRVRSIAAMEWLGRYSMTDVMVLALIIFYVNSSGYSEAQVQPGIYFFAASALMTMFAYGWAHTVAPRPKIRTAPAQLVRVPATRAHLVGGRKR